MANLRIEFFQDKRGDARARDPLGGATLVVTGTATSGGSRPVVPAAQTTGPLIALFESDAPVYIDVGSAPNPGSTADATLVYPGRPVELLVNAGDLISAITAADINTTTLAALSSGSAIIGKVGIDQTAPGTTDKVTAVGAQIATATATIANGASLSGAVDLGTARLAKINMPAAWTAAVLTFQTSSDGVTYRDLYDSSGTEISYTVAASRSVIVSLADWIGTRFVKVRSGTAAAAVNQGADRALELVAVP
jgi:hypothetical protein